MNGDWGDDGSSLFERKMRNSSGSRRDAERDDDWLRKRTDDEERDDASYQAPRERKQKKERPRGRESALTDEDLRELDELDGLESEEARMARERRGKIAGRIGMGMVTLACVYLATLIFGTLSTQFEYSDSGEIVPVVMTVDELQERDDFNSVLSVYVQLRKVYEKILNLDYRREKGVEDPVKVAPLYTEVMDDLEVVGNMINSINLPKNSKYNQVLVNMQYTGYGTDSQAGFMATYCSNVPTAYTGAGDEQEQAVANVEGSRDDMEKYFANVTENLIVLGDDVRGVDVTDLRDWSPEGYVRTKIEGIED